MCSNHVVNFLQIPCYVQDQSQFGFKLQFVDYVIHLNYLAVIHGFAPAHTAHTAQTHVMVRGTVWGVVFKQKA